MTDLPFTNHCLIDGFSYCTVRSAQSNQMTAITRLILTGGAQ